MKIGAIGYFWIVMPHPRSLLGCWCGVVMLGVWWMATDRIDPTGFLALLLYLQMFTTSIGFRVPARHGYFDPLLISSGSVWSVACAHWFVAAAPGLAGWLATGALELGLWGTGLPVAFQASSLVALFLVSTIPWALTLPLPRWSGGVLWTMVLVGLGATREGVALMRMAATDTEVGTVLDLVVTSLAVVMCPFVLVNPSAGTAATSAPVVIAAGSAAAAAFVAGLCFIVRQDYPLVPSL